MLKIMIIAAALLGLTIAGSAVLRHNDGDPWQAGMKGFAVVELFTSEGCSSCPPADALIARVQQQDKDLPVYVLAYHVDYWDRLGWKDAFSNAAYTERQRQYATWLKITSIYTPQVVVNGRTEFVGSEAGMLARSIKNALQQSDELQLSLSSLQLNGGQLDWTCKAEGGTATRGNYSLVVAVVQRSATTQVKGGENGGRTLSHVQIVRDLRVSALDGKGLGAGQLAWPAGVAPGDGEVIAFLQDADNGKIVAATRRMVGQ
ncbi:MAG TPA: DUF1223 domain-containing protein [Puia sp.]|nr:DUF1223 domain-containing protein [Puia sp.]